MRVRQPLFCALLACAASAAIAAPFAVTYTGEIDQSEFALIMDGQRYTVNFVFDNGGNTAVNQVWTGAHLTCTIWSMNDAGNLVFAQDLATSPPTEVSGSITTNGAGVLTGMFTVVNGDPAGPAFSSSGFAHTVPVHWFANGVNEVFGDAAQVRTFYDASGGVQMAPANWLLHTYDGPCAAPPPAPAPTPVPTLGGAGLAALAALLAGLGGVARRRRA